MSRQRVTAFIRLMDERYYGDAKDYLSYVKMTHRGTVIKFPIRMSNKEPSGTLYAIATCILRTRRESRI